MFKSIRSKFIVGYSLYVGIFIAIIIGTIYIQEKSRLFNLAINNSMEISKLHSEILGNLIEKNIFLLTNIKNSLPKENLNKEKIMQKLVQLEKVKSENYLNIVFIDKNGILTDILGRTKNINETKEFQESKNNHSNSYLVGPLMAKILNKPVISLGVPLETSSGEFNGIIAVVIELTQLSKKISNVKINGNSYGWIINQEGFIVAHPEKKYLMFSNIKKAHELGFPEFIKISDKILSTDSGFEEYTDKNIKQKKIVTYNKIPNTPGWKLAITTLKKDIYSGVNVILKKVLIGGVFMLFVLIFIIFKLTNSITTPIKKLTTSVIKSMNRNFEPLDMEITDNDEIANLIFAYNEMTIAISMYTEELENIVAERTEELDILNKQLAEQNEQLSEENENLYDKATRDALTGLFNRAELNKKMENIVEEIKKNIISECSLLFLDLDNFKYYNDTFSHDVGDKILKLISKNLKNHIREKDFIARYGGDEFVLVLPKINLENSKHIKEKLTKCIDDFDGLKKEIAVWMNLEKVEIPKEKHIGVSIGVYNFNKDNITSIENLLTYVDKQMYEEKRRRKAKFNYKR